MPDRGEKRIRDRIREAREDRQRRTRTGRGGREAGYGTVYYSNAFDEQGVVTGRIRIDSFGETDSPAVIVAREGRKSLFHLDDVERIDYHAPDDE